MQKYNKKKMRNQVVEKFAKRYVSEEMAEQVKNCANWIQFIENKERDVSKWLRANTCKWRFCPMCAMRKSYRDALKISTVMAWMKDEHKKAFIMLTLTTPNVKAEDLPATIDRLNKGWHKLFKRNDIADRANHGFARKLEITYDGEKTITRDMWEGKGKHKGKPRAEYFTRLGLKIGDANPNYDTYHPHFHALVAVNKSYFTSRDYISHAKWLRYWQESMQDPSITQVDVRRMKNDDVRELAKYAAKDEDYTVDKHVFDTFYKALKGRQYQTFSGLFAAGNKKFKAKELEKYITPDKTEYMYEVFYRWRGTEYEQQKLRRLDAIQDSELTKRGIIIAP